MRLNYSSFLVDDVFYSRYLLLKSVAALTHGLLTLVGSLIQSSRMLFSNLSIHCCPAAAAAKLLQSCPTLRPHRWQLTRLLCPWDSPGKNTGMGCHFLLQCMKVKSESEVAQLCLTLSVPMDCSLPGSSIHRIFQARVLDWVAIAFSGKKA